MRCFIQKWHFKDWLRSCSRVCCHTPSSGPLLGSSKARPKAVSVEAGMYVCSVYSRVHRAAVTGCCRRSPECVCVCVRQVSSFTQRQSLTRAGRGCRMAVEHKSRLNNSHNTTRYFINLMNVPLDQGSPTQCPQACSKHSTTHSGTTLSHLFEVIVDNYCEKSLT